MLTVFGPLKGTIEEKTPLTHGKKFTDGIQ